MPKMISEFSLESIFNKTILGFGMGRYDFLIVITMLVVVFIISILKEKGINIREALSKKNIMQSSYGIKDLSYESLSKSFIKRRNKIAHGEFTSGFEDIDMISYTLVKMSIYCLILERCSVPLEQIKKICNKIF